MEPIWVKIFTRDTYSCIKNRGIHALLQKLQSDLASDPEGTKYCLKLDIKKFYPSINHKILKQIIRKKIKDKNLLKLLDEIIDSADGVPIGNYLSQFFANLYLAYFDHWVKEELKVKYYYRYAGWNGKRVNISSLRGKYIHIITIQPRKRYFLIQFVRNGRSFECKSASKALFWKIAGLEQFPATIKINNHV